MDFFLLYAASCSTKDLLKPAAVKIMWHKKSTTLNFHICWTLKPHSCFSATLLYTVVHHGIFMVTLHLYCIAVCPRFTLHFWHTLGLPLAQNSTELFIWKESVCKGSGGRAALHERSRDQQLPQQKVSKWQNPEFDWKKMAVQNSTQLKKSWKEAK